MWTGANAPRGHLEARCAVEDGQLDCIGDQKASIKKLKIEGIVLNGERTHIKRHCIAVNAIVRAATKINSDPSRVKNELRRRIGAFAPNS